MSGQIDPSTCISVLKAVESMSQSDAAKKFGLSRTTIRRIIDEADENGIRENHRIRGDIKFKRGDFFCDVCKRMVPAEPCPVCVAKKARAQGIKSAIAGIRIRERKKPGGADEIDEAIWLDWWDSEGHPPEVDDHIARRLGKMIEQNGRHESVAEAIEILSGQFFLLIEAIANSIGEHRRGRDFRKSKYRTLHT